MKYTLYIAFLILYSNMVCLAQNEMTLAKAISIGMENNFGIKIDEVNIQIAENNNTWARAGRGIKVDFNANFSNNLTKDNNEASFLNGTYYTGSFGPSINAQWLVLSGGRMRIAKAQLGQAVDQQKLAKDAAIHDLIKNINQAYYNVIFQKDRLQLLEENLNLSKDRLSYEETKKDFGSSNSYNLLQFENAILSDTTILLTQHQAVEVAKRTLYDVLDIIGMPNYQYSEELNVTLEEINADNLITILSEQNYTLKTLEMIAHLNRLNTQIEKSATKPTLNLSSSLGFTQSGFNSNEINFRTQEAFGFISSNRWDGNITANFNWNIIDGGLRKDNIQSAQLQEEIDQLTLLEAKATLGNQLDLLLSNYNNQKSILQLTNDQLQLTDRNLRMTEERFKSGIITSLDYRNVQIQRLSAAFSKATALYNLIITKSEIDHLVGRFEEN